MSTRRLELLALVLFRHKKISYDNGDEWMGGRIQVFDTAITKEEIRTRIHPACRAHLKEGTKVLYLIKPFIENDDDESENLLVPVLDASDIVELTAESILRKRVTDTFLLDQVMPEMLLGVGFHDAEDNEEEELAMVHMARKKMDKFVDLSFKLRNTPLIRWMVDHRNFIPKLDEYFSNEAWAKNKERYGKNVVMGEQVSMVTKEIYFSEANDDGEALFRQADDVTAMVDYLFDATGGYHAVFDYQNPCLRRTPEHVACLRGDAGLLYYILFHPNPKMAGKHTKPLPMDAFGETPLHNLASKGHFHLAHLYKKWLEEQEELQLRTEASQSNLLPYCLIPLEDFSLTNRDGLTALEMCDEKKDGEQTVEHLMMLLETLQELHATIYDDEDDEDAMTPEELVEWVKTKETDFLTLLLDTKYDEDDDEAPLLKVEKLMQDVNAELKKIMLLRLRPTLLVLQEKYYVLGKCFQTQPTLSLVPEGVPPLKCEDDQQRKDLMEEFDDNRQFSYDFDFTSSKMYGIDKFSLLGALVAVGHGEAVTWILEKIMDGAYGRPERVEDNKEGNDDVSVLTTTISNRSSDPRSLLNRVFQFACLVDNDVAVEVVDTLLPKIGVSAPQEFLKWAVETYNYVVVDQLIDFHDVKATFELVCECVKSTGFGHLWKNEYGLPTNTEYYHKKMKWKSMYRVDILKKLVGKYQLAESGVDWQNVLGLAIEELLGDNFKSDIPLPRELLEYLLTKENVNLLEITDGLTSKLDRAPEWFTEVILPTEEEKRREKQRLAIARYVQPLVRGTLVRRQVQRTYPDLGGWNRAIFELNRRLGGSEPRRLQFQSWVQLKLDNPIVFQSEEFKILEEAALATQGYDDDFNEADYEKSAVPAFPGMKPSDSHGRVCTILFTSGILNWRRKVKDQKYLGMFRDRIDSLARGGDSYCLSKRLKGSKHGALETKLDKGMRIIWTQRGKERMIWFVCKHDHISKCVELIDKSYDRVVKSRVNYGLQEWEEMDDTDTNKAEPDMLASPEQNTPLKIHSVSVESLATSWNDIDWRPPLKLTAVEEEIVNMPGTVLLLGRSGTGKTLCVCNRMARDRKQFGEGIRQLFVARTRRLCDYVKDLQQREQFGTDTLQHAKFQTMEELAQEQFEKLDEDTSRVWRKGAYVDFKRFRDEFAKGERVRQVMPQRKILLMWTQIRSFIKGSYEAVSRGRPLEEAEYVDRDIIEKDRCRLKEKERADAYKVYAFYKAYLADGGLWDEMDRASKVARLMRAKAERDMEEFGERKTLCQRVYVDEVQDITQAEMAILFYATGSNVDAMFFAGDNAQSVSEGVDFRFAEVRSLVHKITNKLGKIERPQRLERNFRSHERILRVSNFLLERMYVAFPNSVTKLKTDLGLVMGPRPGILAQCSVDQLAGIISENQRLRVLVRDEHRSVLEGDLKARLGSDASSTVLGIREAKGLEFTEVLIVDFFSSIKEKAHHKAWKTIIEGNLEGKLDQIPATMELELKLLYTAITRCCDRLFFVETKRTISFDKWKLHLTTARQGSGPDATSDKLAQIMEPEQTKSERGIMTVDDYRVEGIENASLVAGEDMDYEDAIKYLERAVGSFDKAGDKLLEEKAQMHLNALHKKEEIKSDSYDAEFGDVFLSFVDAGLAQEARDYCKDYASGGLKNFLQHQLDALITSQVPVAPASSPTAGQLRRSSTMESTTSGMRRLSSMEG